MEFIKKILVLLVVVLFIYILLRLLQKRADILSNQKTEGFSEGLMPTYKDPVVVTIAAATNKRPANIQNAPSRYGSEPIASFFVKSSLDSAYNGSSVSVDMVNYVLSRGYRFLDFEVYLEPLTTVKDGSKMATVGYTNIVSGQRISSNNIRLNDVLTAVMQGAFTSTSPNPSDPLFLQIRPMYQVAAKSDDSSSLAIKNGNNTQLNTQIEGSLELLTDALAGIVTPSTTLSSISGKIVLIMDSNVINGKKSVKLLSMISMDPNSTYMSTVNTGIVTAIPTTTPPVTNDTSSTLRLIETLPFDTRGNILTDNPNPNSIVVQFKPNFSPNMAWLYKSNSDLLTTYENLFINSGGSAFIDTNAIISSATVATTLNSPIVG